MTGTGEPSVRSAAERASLRWMVVLLFFAAMFFLTFPLAIFSDGQFYLRDFHPFFYPQKLFLAQGLSSCSLPLWLPDVGCGVPFMASLQPGVVYPPSLLLLLPGSFDGGLKLLIAFHFLLAFVSFCCLARFLFRSGPWGSCLGGTAYAFGGYLISSVSQYNNLQSAAWAPMVLLALFRFLRRPSFARLTGASLAAALQILGGGVEVTAMTMAVALVLSATGISREAPFRWSGGGASRLRKAWRGPVLVAAALIVGLALSAFQLLPTVEMAGRSSRSGGGLSDEEAGRYSLEPGNFGNICVPRRLTDPGSSDFFKAFPAGRVPWLISIYQGAVIVYLALIGLLAGGRQLVLRLSLGLCSAMGILLALGRSTAVTKMMFALVPGAGWFRYPEKFLFLTALTVPLLAVHGCRSLSAGCEEQPSSAGRRWHFTAEFLAVLLPLAFLASCAVGGGGADSAAAVPLCLLILALVIRLLARRNRLGGLWATVLMAALAAADLSAAHRPLNALVPVDFYREPPQAARRILAEQAAGTEGGVRPPPRCRSTLPGLSGGPPATERPAETPLGTHLVWRAYLSPNTAGLYGISQVRGSTGMELRFPDRRERLLARAGLADKVALLSLWGVSWLVMDRALSGQTDLDLVSSDLDLPEQRLYRLRRPLPRLFLVEGGLAGDYAVAEKAAHSEGCELSDYVEALRSDLRYGEVLGEQSRLTLWSASRLSAEVVVRREGMLLAFIEGYDPGWRASANGRPVKIREGLGGFNLLELPGPGSYRVDLRYRPPGLVHGLPVSLTVLGLLLTLTAGQFCRGRRGTALRPMEEPVDRPGGKT